MRNRSDLLFVVLLLCGPAIVVAAGAPASIAPPASAPQARIALASNPLTRCPALRIAGDEDRSFAGVIFRVGPTGVPSHPSLISPSASQELDTAAMSCVLGLRFQPATRLGDGTAIESWQEIRLRWAAPPAAAGSSSTPVGVPGRERDSPAPSATRSRMGERAEVRVCVDANGRLTEGPKLTSTSGDPGFDSAALEIAKAGSGHYRAGGADGKSAAGCLQLTIGPAGP